MENEVRIFQIAEKDLKSFGRNLINQAKNELLDLVNKTNEERLLTTEQASKLLQVDISTLWRWDKAHILSPIKVANTKRYRMSDIKNLMKGGE